MAPRKSMPPGQLLDRDIEFFQGTLYSCKQEFEMGTVPHFKSKREARDYAEIVEEECTPVIEEFGIWVRVTHDDYDKTWHGPFYKLEEAEAFVEKTWDPLKTGIRMTDDLDGAATQQRPAWIRR